MGNKNGGRKNEAASQRAWSDTMWGWAVTGTKFFAAAGLFSMGAMLRPGEYKSVQPVSTAGGTAHCAIDVTYLSASSLGLELPSANIGTAAAFRGIKVNEAVYGAVANFCESAERFIIAEGRVDEHGRFIEAAKGDTDLETSGVKFVKSEVYVVGVKAENGGSCLWAVSSYTGIGAALEDDGQGSWRVAGSKQMAEGCDLEKMGDGQSMRITGPALNGEDVKAAFRELMQDKAVIALAPEAKPVSVSAELPPAPRPAIRPDIPPIEQDGVPPQQPNSHSGETEMKCVDMPSKPAVLVGSLGDIDLKSLRPGRVYPRHSGQREQPSVKGEAGEALITFGRLPQQAKSDASTPSWVSLTTAETAQGGKQSALRAG